MTEMNLNLQVVIDADRQGLINVTDADLAMIDVAAHDSTADGTSPPSGPPCGDAVPHSDQGLSLVNLRSDVSPMVYG